MYLVIDKKFLILMFLSLITNYIKFSETAINNNMEPNSKYSKNSSTPESFSQSNYDDEKSFDPSQCPVTEECSKLNFPCIKCSYDANCLYGDLSNATCEVKNGVECVGSKQFHRQFLCRYCFLSDHWEHNCMQKTSSCSNVQSFYKTNCTVNSNVLCLGSRQFFKNVKCNWTKGSKYSTALILSITLGGFGVDRFYLGHWQEGIGKLFSFGGLGVWVMVDAILISIGFLGCSDGSLLL